MNIDKKKYFSKYIDKIGIENFEYTTINNNNFIKSTFFCGIDYTSTFGFESDQFKNLINLLMTRVSKYEDYLNKNIIVNDDVENALLLVDKNFLHHQLLQILSKNNTQLNLNEHWELIINNWTLQEFTSFNEKGDVWRKIFKLKKPIAKLVEKLPDKFIAYRAGDENGFSWTLSKEKALWFQNRFKEQFGVIPFLEKEYLRENVLFYTNIRKEEEVVIVS